MYQLIGLAIACVALKARPSTIIRLGEDVLIAAPKNFAHIAKDFGRSVKIEYRARMLNRMQEQLENEVELVRSLSPEQVEQLVKDQATILARADELALQKAQRKAHRASRGGRNASAAQV